ncbi:MAG: hypothetical protein BroJett030_07220 [Alphaproteobacteria bacterium]|nr:MAG: hypothetical protein BroJett030_07220 [Alphaproteobacteria bacterium]
MTDYRDFQSGGYDRLHHDRFGADRQGGGTGVLIALAVVALLLIGFFVLAATVPEPPVTQEGAVQETLPAVPAPAPAEPAQ